VLICPYCGSERVRVSTKEAYQGWQIGLPQFGHFEKSKKVTYSEADCLECGKSFRPELGETPTSGMRQVPHGWIGKELLVQTRKGIQVPVKVISEAASVNVLTKTGRLIADDQLLIEMKENVINMDSPLMLMDSDTPVGIMWASGVGSKGYTTGIVQPILRPRGSKKEDLV